MATEVRSAHPFHALADFSIRRPRRALLVGVLLTLAVLPGLWRLELRTDGQALVPPRRPEILVDAEVRARFDVRDPIVLVLYGSGPEGVFEPTLLRRVQELSAAVTETLGVAPEHVLSLATEKGFRRRRGSFRLRDLLEPPYRDPGAIERLRDDLKRIGLYEGTLIASDGSAAAVVVGTPPGIDRIRFYRDLVALTESPPFDTCAIDVLGAPVAEALLGHHLLADLGLPEAVLGTSVGPERFGRLGMVPVALLVLALLLFAAFRRAFPVLATLALLGLCLLLVFGAMGWLGEPIYLTTAILPVILTAIGVADAIHILLRFQELRGARPAAPAPVLVRETLAELAGPVVRTSLTTAVGFASFAISSLAAARSFGIFTTLGILALMVGALSFLPALLCLAPASWTAPRRGPGSASFFRRLGTACGRRRRVVLWLAAALVLLAVDGVRRVEVYDSWLDGFSPGSAFARETRRFEKRFLGSHRLLVEVQVEAWRVAGEVAGAALDHHELTLPRRGRLPQDLGRLVGGWVRLAQRGAAATPEERPPRNWTAAVESLSVTAGGLRVTTPRRSGSAKFWLRPGADEPLDYELWTEPFTMVAHLRRVAALEAFLAELPGVGGVLGPARYLRVTGFMTNPESPEARRLPDRPEEARVRWHNYGVVRGEARRRQLVTPELDAGLVAVYLRQSNSRDTRRLMDALRAYERTELRPHGIRLRFAGDVAVSQALIQAVVRTQVGSLAFSLLGIFATAAALTRSWRAGLLCVLPSALAVWLDFALIGWTGLPLGVATSMFAGMTLGVGVDSAIHLLARRRQALDSGRGAAEALDDALGATGPAVSLSGLAVGLGFGTLLLSQVPSNARLGGLLLFSVGLCLVATLVLLPAWLFPPREPPSGGSSGTDRQ